VNTTLFATLRQILSHGHRIIRAGSPRPLRRPQLEHELYSSMLSLLQCILTLILNDGCTPKTKADCSHSIASLISAHVLNKETGKENTVCYAASLHLRKTRYKTKQDHLGWPLNKGNTAHHREEQLSGRLENKCGFAP
jgi:hypothetical protein